jgi:hypothetical protein
MTKAFLAVALLVALTISGCSDKGDSSGGSTSSSSETTGLGSNQSGNMSLPPIYINGTVSGAQDCSLAMSGQNPVTPTAIAIPAEAANRSYTLTFSGGQSVPGTSRGCIGFGTGPLTGGTTGTIPAGITSGRIGYNAGQARNFSLMIGDPAP